MSQYANQNVCYRKLVVEKRKQYLNKIFNTLFEARHPWDSTVCSVELEVDIQSPVMREYTQKIPINKAPKRDELPFADDVGKVWFNRLLPCVGKTINTFMWKKQRQ